MDQIPKYIFEIANKLESSGFEVYLVGGSVRNMLLGRPVKDFDLTTNALPEQMAEIFPRSILTNAKFGTVIVVVEDELGELQNVEVTTYRSEKDYVGGRWPSHIEFTTSILEDLKRRDFTINAIAIRLNGLRGSRVNELGNHPRPLGTPSLEPVNPLSRELVNLEDFDLLDPFNGQQDLRDKIIRAVGDPVERFREDGLRALRACRLASVLEFTIEENTMKAMKETLEVAALISKERIRNEFIRLVEESPKPSYGLELMRESGLLQLYIPELLEGYGMKQNEYHVHDVYQHLLDTVDIAPKEIRIAALFHDIGKPRSKDGEHFYGHDRVGAEMTREILTRLKFPRKFIEDTVNLIRWHMFFLPKVCTMGCVPKVEESKKYEVKSKKDNEMQADLKDQEASKKARNEAFKSGWSDAAIRRMIRRVGGHENIDKLIELRIADASANPKSSFNPKQVQALSERIAKIREEDSLLSIKDLKINGHDLIELGIEKGPRMKEILNYLLERVTEDIELNEKEELVKLVKEYGEQRTNNKEQRAKNKEQRTVNN